MKSTETAFGAVFLLAAMSRDLRCNSFYLEQVFTMPSDGRRALTILFRIHPYRRGSQKRDEHPRCEKIS